MAVTGKKSLQPNKQVIYVKLYTPHQGQLRLHRSKARYRVMACGRRWGKTLAVINELLKFMLNHKNMNCLWVSPVYRQCKKIYRVIKRALRDIITHHSDSDLTLTLNNGSRLDFYSATNPDAIRGDGFDAVIFDEFQEISNPDIWFKVVQPTLATTNGWAIFIGTPKGHNLFYLLYQRGLDPLQTEWESFSFSSWESPYVSKDFIETARREMPEDVFNQEIGAIFLAYGAGVIKGLDHILVETLEKGDLIEVLPGQMYLTHAPRPQYTYVIGFDVAKYRDYSVLNVMNVDNMHIDAFYRVHHMDYLEQIKRVKNLASEYNNAFVLQDSTGVGDPVLEMARKEGINAEGFLFTPNSKKMLLEELQLDVEHRLFSLPDIPVQTGELRNLQYKLSPSRQITYEVAKGFTDDCIMSLGLTLHAAGQYANQEVGISVVNPEEEALPVRDYDNDELMERQQRIAGMLGDVELVVSGGDW